MKKNINNHGFTVLEIITIIMIISILSMISVLSVSSLKKKSEEKVALASFKIIIDAIKKQDLINHKSGKKIDVYSIKYKSDNNVFKESISNPESVEDGLISMYGSYLVQANLCINGYSLKYYYGDDEYEIDDSDKYCNYSDDLGNITGYINQDNYIVGRSYIDENAILCNGLGNQKASAENIDVKLLDSEVKCKFFQFNGSLFDYKIEKGSSYDVGIFCTSKLPFNSNISPKINTEKTLGITHVEINDIDIKTYDKFYNNFNDIYYISNSKMYSDSKDLYKMEIHIDAYGKNIGWSSITLNDNSILDINFNGNSNISSSIRVYKPLIKNGC